MLSLAVIFRHIKWTIRGYPENMYTSPTHFSGPPPPHVTPFWLHFLFFLAACDVWAGPPPMWRIHIFWIAPKRKFNFLTNNTSFWPRWIAFSVNLLLAKEEVTDSGLSQSHSNFLIAMIVHSLKYCVPHRISLFLKYNWKWVGFTSSWFLKLVYFNSFTYRRSDKYIQIIY